MTNIPYVSLHNQTEYSILDSLISVKDLFRKAKELGQPAVAITDHGTLGAAWEAFKVSQETGVKLIMGCEFYFVEQVEKPSEKFRHLILLAKNAEGYRNLLTLSKVGFDRGVYTEKRVYPLIDWQLLRQYHDGLICLTACGNGIVSQLLMQRQTDVAKQTLHKLVNIFGDDFGIEVQPNNMKRGSNAFNNEVDQTFLNRQLINLGRELNIKIVAACNAHYLKSTDKDIHDVLLAVGSHQPIFSNYRIRYPESDFYLKSGEEVEAFFSRNYDPMFGEGFARSLCDNSIYFADKCENPDWINPKYSNPDGKELAIFPVQDAPDYFLFQDWVARQAVDIQQLTEDKLYLRFKCLTAFERLKENNSYYINNEPLYLARINEELDVLEYQGFSSYMLIVADYVDWCVKNQIPVGPGRGSCGGCFLAFLLGIHQADSIKYDLLFARFQNKQRSQAPDIDQDISATHRDRVIEYIRKKYGADKMCSVSNYNTIKPKVYVRDVSRALTLGGSREEAVKVGNLLAESIAGHVSDSNNIDTIIGGSPLFAEYCKKYPEIIKYGSILGKFRAHSQHAAAIIINQRSLVGLVPLRRDKDKNLIIEYDKDKSEENGFVKMDLLGLSTLDIINKTLYLIKEHGGTIKQEYVDYDANDLLTYELISKGDTFCVFQLGSSSGTIDLCKKIKPKNIEDLAIITTLARPAAADIRQNFIDTRDGKRSYSLLHSSLAGAFAKTFGYGLFDESILKLGSDVAGWDLNSADRIRKMIKEKGKYPEKDAKLRQEFIRDAVIYSKIDTNMATAIWDNEIKKFAGYTFNKAHAITYSMISYQTAYLKAHFPTEFLLANLMFETKSNSPSAKDNVVKIKKELRHRRIKILAPDINKSQRSYSLLEKNKIITGFEALRGVGDDAIREILTKRPFANLADLVSRTDSRKLRSNHIQALALTGCLNYFGIKKKSIYLYISDFRKKLFVWEKKHKLSEEKFIYPWVEELEWSKDQIYAMEYHYLNEAFSCPAYEAYGDFFQERHVTIKDIKEEGKDSFLKVPMRGIVRDIFEFRVKKINSKFYGQIMVKCMLEDKDGDLISCTIFPNAWEEILLRMKELNNKAKFINGLGVSLSGITNLYEGELNVIVNDLFAIALPPQMPEDLKARKVRLKMERNKKKDNLLEEIEDRLYLQGAIDLDQEEKLGKS